MTRNRFNTYLVVIFTNENRAQVYKMVCKDIPKNEFELVMTFNFINLFRPKDHKEEY